MSTIEKSPLIKWGARLTPGSLRHCFRCGESDYSRNVGCRCLVIFWVVAPMLAIVWEPPCRRSRCGFDRSDDIAGVISKEIEQRTCSRSARVRQAEPACDARLQRPAETVFGPACEQVQMTPHLPQEAVRLDQPGRLERHGARRGAGVGPERALQVSETTGASLQVGLVLQGIHIARCMARRGRQSAADRVLPASRVGASRQRPASGPAKCAASSASRAANRP